MTAEELLKGVWFWFVALFTLPAFAGWVGYFAHVIAAPHFELTETAMVWAARGALLALSPWLLLVGTVLVMFIIGGPRR